MEQVGFVWTVRPGCAKEYDRRHAEIWPELADVLRDAGVRSFHIYRWGEVVFSHMDVEDFRRLAERYGDDSVAKRWEAEFEDLLEYPNADPETGWPERLLHVWSLK